MPIFGDKSTFAIEYNLLPDYEGVWLFGYITFWCGNRSLGRCEEETSLRDVLFQLEQMRWSFGKRQSDRFGNMEAKAAFILLRNILYKCPFEDVSEDVVRNWEEASIEEQWARHQLVPAIDVFDHDYAYYIESENLGRIVGEDGGCVFEVAVPLGLVDSVLQESIDSLSFEYEKELSKQPDPDCAKW